LTLLVTTMAGADAPIQFTDISEAAGFQPGHLDSIPAGGIAVADFNRNGWPDIFVTGGVKYPNRMYFNQGDGSFSRSAEIDQQLSGENCSVAAAADFNNDGWPDLYVGCRWSDNKLFMNLAGQGFADATPPELNHNVPAPSGVRTDAVAWGDITGNGFLDLYVGIFTGLTDTSNPDLLDRILLNHGNGSWTNVAESLDPDKLIRPALAVTFSDLTGNGRQDIYVIIDKLAGNILWRNDGPGCGGWCFTDVSDPDTTGLKVYGMGIAIGDINRNGQWDLFFSSIFNQHLLRGLSQDPLVFSHDTETPLNTNDVGWATILADFDNDGWEDAFLAVGPENFAPVTLADRVFHNQGDGSFEEVSTTSGLYAQIPTQAAALIDYNRNGRLDLVLHHWNRNPGYRLYRNNSDNDNHWIALELVGGGPINRDAVGSLVVIETPDGGIQRRQLRAGESRGASHQPLVHFGLGSEQDAEVTVHWPDGTTSKLGTLSGCRYHRIQHPQGQALPGWQPPLLNDRFQHPCD
jgi:enediyne biosynthesis protein E4